MKRAYIVNNKIELVEEILSTNEGVFDSQTGIGWLDIDTKSYLITTFKIGTSKKDDFKILNGRLVETNIVANDVVRKRLIVENELAQAKRDKIKDIKTNYQTLRTADITIDLGGTDRVFTFPNPATNLAELSDYITSGVTDLQWRDNQGEVRITTITNLKILQKSMNTRGQILFNAKIAKEIEVNNATTKDLVRAITI